MPAFMIFIKPVLGLVLKVLTFGITIPVGIIIAFMLWLHFDKSSDIRQAVNEATEELVAGAEISSQRAKNDALQLIIDDLQNQTDALNAANDRFSENLISAQNELDDANGQIRKLSSRPVNSDCVVDKSVLDILRNR